MSKFPVMRDLSVDRSRMFDALKKVQAWGLLMDIMIWSGEKILPFIRKSHTNYQNV